MVPCRQASKKIKKGPSGMVSCTLEYLKGYCEGYGTKELGVIPIPVRLGRQNGCRPKSYQKNHVLWYHVPRSTIETIEDAMRGKGTLKTQDVACTKEL